MEGCLEPVVEEREWQRGEHFVDPANSSKSESASRGLDSVSDGTRDS